MNQTHAVISLKALRDDRLTLNDVRLIGALSSRADENGRCNASKQELIELSGVKRIGKGINNLCRYGYLIVETDSNGTNYRLLEKPDDQYKPGRTLNQFTEEYVGYLSATHSAAYARDTKAAFRKLADFAEDIPLDQLSPITLETFFASTFKKAQYSTARNYRSLKAAFNHATGWNYLSANPLVKIRLPKTEKSIPAFITEVELGQIAATTKNSTLRDIFVCGFHTGMRLSEILNLRWSAVNLSEHVITVSNTATFRTKNGRERTIPVNDTLLAVLQARFPKVLNINRGDLVFGKTQKVPFTKNYVGRKFKAAVRECGLNERLHTHSLRHSFASILLQRGCSIKIVQELLGHSSVSTTMQYLHTRQEDMRSAVGLLGNSEQSRKDG